MGYVLVAVRQGSGAGVGLFNLLLMRLGQIDIFVSLAYVLFLGTVGAIIFESLGTTPQPPLAARHRLHRHYWCTAGR